jgi:hypothetical protein
MSVPASRIFRLFARAAAVPLGSKARSETNL